MVKHPQKDSFKAFLSRAKSTLPGRWFWLLIGLGLISYSQYLMQQHDFLGDANPTLDLWNVTHRLEIVNIQNLGAAIPFLFVGGFISALAFLPSWKVQDNRPTSPKTALKPDWSYLLPRIGFGLLLFVYLIYKLAQHAYNPILPWLWFIILVLSTHLVYKYAKSRNEYLSLRIKRIDVFWIAGIFLAGLAIGSFALQDIPNIMIPDEGSFWENGRAIAAGEFKPAFFDFGVYTFPISSSIFQGWVMRMVGINLWGWRFSSVLAGILTVFPLYLLAREWFDRRVAVIATLFMFSSPYYLSFARMGYNNSQALFPVVLCLYFWSLGYKRNNLFFYWMSGLAAGLGFYTYTAAWLGPVTVVVAMLLLTIIRRISFRPALLAGVAFLSAAAITAGPRLVYGASSQNAEPLFFKLLETSFVSSFYGSAYYGPAELYPDQVAYMVGENRIFYAPEVYVEMLTRSTVRTLAALFDSFIVTEHFMVTNFSGGFLPAIGLALGLGLSLRTVKQTRSILLLIWLGAGLFFLSIIAAFPPRHTHLVTVIPALAILSALGFTVSVDTIISEVRRKWSQLSLGRISGAMLALVSLASVLMGIRSYFITMPERNPPLFEDIVSWIAWRTEEPITIVYVGRTDIRHRVQYQVDTRMALHKYLAISAEDFEWQGLPVNSIVFYEQQVQGIPAPLPNFSNFASYTNKDGGFIGYAWSDTKVDLQPQPLFTGLADIPIPAVLGIMLISLIVSLMRGKIRLEKKENGNGVRLTAELWLRETHKKEKSL